MCVHVLQVLEWVHFFSCSTSFLISGDLQSMKMEVVQPIRILVTLLDKEDIGPQIIDDVLLDVTRALYAVCQPLHEDGLNQVDARTASRGPQSPPPQRGPHHQYYKGLDELRLQAQTFFEQLNPALLWQHFASCFMYMEQSQQILPDVVTKSHQLHRQRSGGSTRSSVTSDVGDSTKSPEDHVKSELKPDCSFEELVDLTTFMLAFMPLVSQQCMFWKAYSVSRLCKCVSVRPFIWCFSFEGSIYSMFLFGAYS